MTKETMIKQYRKYAAHDEYLIELTKDNIAYVVRLLKLMPRMMYITCEASKRGGGRKLKLNINAKDRDYLIKHNCVFSYPANALPTNRYKNKGHAFECLIWEHFGIESYHPDSIGFWHDGDVTIDGIKFQLKRNGAQIVKEKTLETLKTYERLGVIPPETFNCGTAKQLKELKEQRKRK